MSGLINTIKKFVTNKNTVTILGVLAGVIVLWYFYNMRVEDAINPQRVPYALKELGASDPITSEDIGYMEVNSDFLKTADVITNVNQLIGRFVDAGTSIPEGGLFYQSQVVDEAELPDSIFDEIPDGFTIFQLGVNNTTTYANSIYPGNRIDLYLRASEDGKVIYGKFIESIEVLAVRDSSGKNVFSSTSKGTPSLLLFAVPDDYYDLLRKAEFISGVTIYPVPRNRVYTEEAGETQFSSQQLIDFINARSITISG